MELRAILTMMSSLFVFASARGPHHPRGERRHVHSKPSDKLTKDVDILHDKSHIQEHLEEIVPKPDLSKMTDEELELYYFLLHDNDKNSKLDGLEILNAILHTTHESIEDSADSNDITQDKPNLDEFIELVDKVLEEDDENRDGYLSYAEYVKGIARNDLRERQPSVQIVK